MNGRVAVLKAYGRDFELREYPVPDPEPGAVLIRLTRAGVCGSDPHIWRGEMKEIYGALPRDLTFGHEMCGRVARLGAGVTVSLPTSRRRTLMRMARVLPLLTATGLLFAVATAGAQAPPPPAYGPAITLEQAKKVMAGAEAEAKKNSWPVVIAIVDSGGNLVMLTRLDNAQWGSTEVAKDKAHSAVAFRRPTKVFQDAIGQGGANLRLLNLSGASLLEGGIPIVVDGKIVGAVGVSGVTSQQDAQIGQAGIDALLTK